MAHVGVERLGAGDGQEHRRRAPASPTGRGRARKRDAVGRVERGEDARVVADVQQAAERAMATNQTSVIGPNQRRDARRCRGSAPRTARPGSRRLIGSDVGLEARASTSFSPSTAESTEIAGVIDRVAVEQRGAGDAEHEERARCVARPRAARAPSATACRPRRCCRRAGSGATYLSVTIDDQRPEHQRDDADHHLARRAPSPAAAACRLSRSA